MEGESNRGSKKKLFGFIPDSFFYFRRRWTRSSRTARTL
ncbi:hypothetical protein L21SP2_2112 [Salinispira pacifica]|uniref:Uncharacterized protein n=1 Tax=Salinispira pacifica TaxID=1307761 RepID=V5WI21_9SPIO|nr:hypothetical protein L21SP2_2110 [Salinispira pacifica]AHC15478.1 hypothetical protein L21SP2_2111 [Salinispira pacifica]AHC15479.1 hypothetical protein L21SP2_2112 [Salinispira pacifica]